MESFGDFFNKLWLSNLPRQLVWAICVAAVFEALVWVANRQIRHFLRPALTASSHPDPVVRALRSRLLLRPPMMLMRAVLYVIAVAIILRIFGLDLRREVFPLVGAAFATALAATWPLLQDAARGYMLLLHDVWAVGDRVQTGEVTGVVEQMGLLHTRLRMDDGGLLTIANGRVTQVVNLSRATKPSVEGSQPPGPA
ncbi:MAG: mechanosensitive ion channel [Armatimonadetes bacterium]|nr:mechanosensitive ion channel [Armatimonadota bacterium]